MVTDLETRNAYINKHIFCNNSSFISQSLKYIMSFPVIRRGSFVAEWYMLTISQKMKKTVHLIRKYSEYICLRLSFHLSSIVNNKDINHKSMKQSQ